MRRGRRQRRVFVRNFFSQNSISGGIAGAPSVVQDTLVASPAAMLGDGPDRITKGITIVGIDWRSDIVFVSQSGGTAAHVVYFSEGLYRGQSAIPGGASAFSTLAFLQEDEIGAKTISVSQWPKRLAMRRTSAVGVTTGDSCAQRFNWHPLRIRNKIRLAMDENLYWRIESRGDGGAPAVFDGDCFAHGAFAYYVTT